MPLDLMTMRSVPGTRAHTVPGVQATSPLDSSWPCASQTNSLVRETAASVTGFLRIQLGEGIDKPPTDLAADVAAQLKH